MKILIILFVYLQFSIISLADGKRQSLSPKTKQELLKVFSVNEELHNAFFEYEKKKTQLPNIATQLSQAMDGISDPKIKGLLNFSQTKLNEIKSDASKADNNQNYHLVSMALIHLLNKYDLGSSYNAYSCPMVNKKWIQNSTKIAKVHNPYAPKMPHCGTKDTKH